MICCKLGYEEWTHFILVHLIINVTSTVSYRQTFIFAILIPAEQEGSSSPLCLHATGRFFSLHQAFITVKIYILANVTIGAASTC